MPTSQRPSRAWPGRGLRLFQPKRSRADAQALDELALREAGRLPGFSGSTCVSLRMRNSTGSSAELLGHLVHGDLQRHHARRLARRAHGVAFGQVEHGEPRRRHAVGAGIEQPRLADRGLGLAAGQVAGPALMADGGDLAVAASRRCGCAGSSPADAWCC